MRIGIDCRTILAPKLGEKAGVGHYTYYLVKYLLALDKKNEYVLFFDFRCPNPAEFRRKNVKIVHFPFSQYKKYLPFGYSHLLIAAALGKEQLDVYHSPANAIPLNYKGKSVLTVHDLAIYDHPEWFPPKQEFSTRVVVPKSVYRAAKIIAVSKSTAESIERIFKIPKDKIRVIYEGFAKNNKKISSKEIKQIKKKFKLNDKYIFYVGTLEPRKNLASAIQAFDNLLNAHYKKYQGYQFVIAGAKGWKYDDIFTAIAKSRSGYVKYINYISHKEKLALMQSAACFIFPSLWEGFGLPVLEAMSLGTPVITSKLSSLPEVVDKAGLLVNPNKALEIEKALAKLLNSSTLRKSLAKKGIQQAKKFSWKKCAKETLKIYQNIAKQ